LLAVVVLESEELSADFSETEGFAVSDAAEPVPSEDLPLYPSAYQPDPLSWNELLETSFFTVPAQSGHAVNGFSVIRWKTSKTLQHDMHSYS
jgi:hypothetical protein